MTTHDNLDISVDELLRNHWTGQAGTDEEFDAAPKYSGSDLHQFWEQRAQLIRRLVLDQSGPNPEDGLQLKPRHILAPEAFEMLVRLEPTDVAQDLIATCTAYPDIDELNHGIDLLRQYYTDLVSAFPDMTVEIHRSDAGRTDWQIVKTQPAARLLEEQTTFDFFPMTMIGKAML